MRKQKPTKVHPVNLSFLLLPLVLILSQFLRASEVEFEDPRPANLYRWIQDGKQVVERTVSIGSSLLIIHWHPSPSGAYDVYQISGVEGLHSKERVEAFLRAFYAGAKELRAPINVIVAGNDWATGLTLGPTLEELSAQYKFSVYRASEWAFKKANLTPEPYDRALLIQNAFRESEQASSAK